MDDRAYVENTALRCPAVSQFCSRRGLESSHDGQAAVPFVLSEELTRVVIDVEWDTKRYLPLVEVFDLTEEEKGQLIRDVITVMESALDAQLGLHPVQQNRGYPGESSLRNPDASLDSEDNHVSDLFGGAANEDVRDSKEERRKHG